MEWFKFNDVHSDSLNIIVKEMPLVPRAERNMETLEIIGRNGNLHIDNNSYKSREYTLDCICTDNEKIDDVCKTFVGTHKLELSKYSDRYFNATIKNQIDFKTYFTYLNEFPLQFEIEPIAYSKNEIIETITSNKTINVDGNVEVSPIIEVTGTGTVTVNGYPFIVNESNIVINCELMQCYNGNIAKNDKVVLDEFPVLKVGQNNIVLGTGITKVVIRYRKGWL